MLQSGVLWNIMMLYGCKEMITSKTLKASSVFQFAAIAFEMKENCFERIDIIYVHCLPILLRRVLKLAMENIYNIYLCLNKHLSIIYNC